MPQNLTLNATGIDTSMFSKTADLACLKLDVDELIIKLEIKKFLKLFMEFEK